MTDRLDLTLRLVRGAGQITLAELANRLSVSLMTVRRDLDELQRQGFVQRVRGGAVSLATQPEEAGFAAREPWQAATKARIGAAAAGLIAANSTVLLDAGTTTAALAPQLEAPLTVATLSLQAANRLADKPGIRLMVIGGESRPGERSLVGHLTVKMLDELWFDTFVMSIGAVHAQLGWSEFAPEDASVKQHALRRAERTIVVADSTKLGVVAFTKVADLGLVDMFVTDSAAEGDTLDAIKQAGVEVVLV